MKTKRLHSPQGSDGRWEEVRVQTSGGKRWRPSRGSKMGRKQTKKTYLISLKLYTPVTEAQVCFFASLRWAKVSRVGGDVVSFCSDPFTDTDVQELVLSRESARWHLNAPCRYHRGCQLKPFNDKCITFPCSIEGDKYILIIMLGRGTRQQH